MAVQRINLITNLTKATGLLLYAKTHGKITNFEYRELTGVSDRTVLRDLNELIARQIIKKIGTTGKNTSYTEP